jgi:hypothetical protein
MSAALHPEAVTETTRPAVQPCTAAQMAAEAGVSRRMIFLGLKVHLEACPELWQMVRDGSATMNLAAALVDMFPNHDDQRTVITEFSTLPVREWLGFARRVAALCETPPKAGLLKTPDFGAVSLPTPPNSGAFVIGLPSHQDGNSHAGRRT